MTLYVSFEQEFVLSADRTVGNLVPTADPFRHGFVVVSTVPWGQESDDWKELHTIGPIHETAAEQAVERTVRLLESLGNKVVTNDTAKGEWAAGGIYLPHQDEK